MLSKYKISGFHEQEAGLANRNPRITRNSLYGIYWMAIRFCDSGILPFCVPFSSFFCLLSDLIKCCQILSCSFGSFLSGGFQISNALSIVNFLKSCYRALSVKSWMSCQPSASTTAFSSPTCWPFTPGLRKKTKEQRSLSTPNAGVTTNEILSSLFCSPFSPSS